MKDKRPHLTRLHEILESSSGCRLPFDIMDIMIEYLLIVPDYYTTFVEHQLYFERSELARKVDLKFWGPLMLEAGFAIQLRYHTWIACEVADDLNHGMRLTDIYRHLSFSRSPLQDLKPLHNLKSLRSLDLSYTPVEDLSPLKRLCGLKKLDLSYTLVKDITPLCHLQRLQSLKLTQTEVDDLTPLRHLKHLEMLDVELTRVDDVGPLSCLNELRRLKARETHIRDFSPLRGLEKVMVYAGTSLCLTGGSMPVC